MSSTPTTPTTSPSQHEELNSNATGLKFRRSTEEKIPSRRSSSSSASEDGPSTPPTHPNSPYASSRTGNAYPRLHTAPFTTDPLDPASRRDSSNALRASVFNVFAELGALENSQYANWMFGNLPGWEEQSQNWGSGRAPNGAGLRFQSGSRFRERLDSVGSSMALLDGYMRLTGAGRGITEESDEEEEEEDGRGWAGSRFWKPKSRSKSRTRSKSRQRKEKERDIKFKEPAVPKEGARERSDVKRKSVWRKSFRASGYESDGAALSVSTGLRNTLGRNKSLKRNPSQTRKEDISAPCPRSEDSSEKTSVDHERESSGITSTSTLRESNKQSDIPSYTTPFPLSVPLETPIVPLTRSISHDDINPRTNRQSLSTLNTLVLEEQWDKIDPLSTIDFQTLGTWDNPFVGTGKLKKLPKTKTQKPPKSKKSKGKDGKDSAVTSTTSGSRVASPMVPESELAPIPIVDPATRQSGSTADADRMSRRNAPNRIELPSDTVPFPRSGSSLSNLPPLPRSRAEDVTPYSEVEAEFNQGGGSGLFSRLARPFLASQTSKRSIKLSKASVNYAPEQNTPSGPSTPRSSGIHSHTPQSPLPPSPLGKPSNDMNVPRASEDSKGWPGTPLSPLSRALEGERENAQKAQALVDFPRASVETIPGEDGEY